MDSCVFLTDNNKKITEELSNLYINQGYTVINTINPEILKTKQKEENSNPIKYISWNKNSIISSKNAALELKNSFPDISSFYFNLNPIYKSSSLFHEESITSIDEIIDQEFKSYIILIKEIIYHNFKKENVKMNYVIHLDESLKKSNIGLLCLNSLFGIIKSLFEFYNNSQFLMNCFYSEASSADTFANHINNTLKTKAKNSSGKIYKYQTKKGLFF